MRSVDVAPIYPVRELLVPIVNSFFFTYIFSNYFLIFYILYQGPIIKIAVGKLDFCDIFINNKNITELQLLAHRAEIENRAAATISIENKKELLNNPKNKKKKKLAGRENKGNFSSYRNKSFIPNASRQMRNTNTTTASSTTDTTTSTTNTTTTSNVKMSKKKNKKERKDVRFLEENDYCSDSEGVGRDMGLIC